MSAFGTPRPEFCVIRRARYLLDPEYLALEADRDAIRQALRDHRAGETLLDAEAAKAAAPLYGALDAANRRLAERAVQLDQDLFGPDATQIRGAQR
jgi:hypothetical protein